MDQPCCNSAKEVEKEVSERTKSILDIVSENMEKPHISQDVEESSVKKHGSQERESLLEGREFCREAWIGVSNGKDTIEGECFLKAWPLRKLPEKSQHVDNDDRDIDYRKMLRPYGISNGDHSDSNIIGLDFENKQIPVRGGILMYLPRLDFLRFFE